MDHFKPVLVWPAAQNHCTTGGQVLGIERFTIHGLLPQDANWMGLMNGRGAKTFDIVKLEDSMKDLKTNWPGIGKSNYSFWRSQWEKHGSCSGLTLVNYFKETLHAHTRIGDIKKFLEQGGVRHRDTLYWDQQIGSTIHNGFGFIPQLCYRVDHDGSDMLHHVSFEMDAHLNQKNGIDIYCCHHRKGGGYIRFAK